MIRACLIAALVALLPATAKAQADAPDPYILVRALQFLQDDIVTGNRVAHGDQGTLLGQIARELSRAPADVWKDDKNVLALVVYLFSGGQPEPVRILLSQRLVGGDNLALLRGALAYAEGREAEARSTLTPLDPRGYGASVGGPLALVQATLLAGTEPAKAMGLLDLARLLMPGSIVEEAAMRRAIVLAASMRNVTRFAFLSDQYLRRFRRSIYSSEFLPRMTQATVEFAKASDQKTFDQLDRVFAAWEARERDNAYREIVRATLMSGNRPIAGLAANRLLAHQPADAAPIRLYAAAADVASSKHQDAIAFANAQKPEAYGREDRDLLLAMRALDREITSWTDPRINVVLSRDEEAKAIAEIPAARRTVIDRARNAIGDADFLMLKELR